MSKRINAFTILEVTVVMAITSLLSALFFNGMNRFSEQLSNEVKLKNEMNEFLRFRTNLWRELDDLDSLHLHEQDCTFYLDTTSVHYTLKEGVIYRNSETMFTGAQPEFTKFQLESTDFVLTASWKNRELHIRYPVKTEVSAFINSELDSDIWPK